MAKVVAIDFGASRVKSALIDLDTREIFNQKDFQPAKNIAIKTGRFEKSPSEIFKIFQESVNYHCQDEKPDAIFLCSEMHGFIIADQNLKPVSNYISWMDQRANEVDADSTSYFISFQKSISAVDFKKITGNTLRTGLPPANLYQMINSNSLKAGNYTILSLPDYLASQCDLENLVAHNSMAASLGFTELATMKVSEQVKRAVLQSSDITCSLPDCSAEVQRVASLQTIKGKIPFYSGIGDQQCALLGAGLEEKVVSLNLGTGSQVAMLANNLLPNLPFDTRPFFESQFLYTITHIPSGRVFRALENFYHEINADFPFWETLKNLSLKKHENLLDINLAIFPGAYCSKEEDGFIANITEANFHSENLLVSWVVEYAEQYIRLIESFRENFTCEKLLFSGGMPARIKELVPYISKQSCLPAEFNEREETMIGLAILADSVLNKKNLIPKNARQHFLLKG